MNLDNTSFLYTGLKTTNKHQEEQTSIYFRTTIALGASSSPSLNFHFSDPNDDTLEFFLQSNDTEVRITSIPMIREEQARSFLAHAFTEEEILTSGSAGLLRIYNEWKAAL